MRAALSILSGIILVITVGWTVLAVGNGKIGTLFGTEIFIASAGDMKAVFILQLLAIPALIYLLIALFTQHLRAQELAADIDKWNLWHESNKGKTIV